jgi:hypothetical protein
LWPCRIDARALEEQEGKRAEAEDARPRLCLFCRVRCAVYVLPLLYYQR